MSKGTYTAYTTKNREKHIIIVIISCSAYGDDDSDDGNINDDNDTDDANRDDYNRYGSDNLVMATMDTGA